MPEDMSVDLGKVLDVLEDNTFDTPIVRNQKLKVVLNVLDSDEAVSTILLERILALAVHELKDDKKYSGQMLKIISSILQKIKPDIVSTLPSLLPSALAILDFMKTSALMNTKTLQIMSFQTLLSYPDEILIVIATLHCNQVIEIFKLYCNQKLPKEVRLLPCDMLVKLLKILPPEKKIDFLKGNLVTWFNVLIPSVLGDIKGSGCQTALSNSMMALEMLAEELQPIDYSANPHWEVLLESIYNPKKYPSLMKSLLESNSPYWDRLWIVVIKLLKKQITRCNRQGSPINALLPVVEAAFKMDVQNRCRAFKCWDALIDNFKMETNDGYVAKRLKLLIVPLHSNNAKVEETAIAKFNTWWRLLTEFQTKVEKFADSMLIGFLNFCFGKNAVSPNKTFVPGLLSIDTTRLCIEAFIEIAGHLKCPGCVSVPKLNRRLLNTHLLVANWHSFSHSLQKVVIIAANHSVGVTTQQIECLWRSFVLTVKELPPSTVRQDMLKELVAVLGKAKDFGFDSTYSDSTFIDYLSSVILNLTYLLFEEETNTLLVCTNVDDSPIYKILCLLLGITDQAETTVQGNLKPLRIYKWIDVHERINRLNCVTDFIMEKLKGSSTQIIDWILKNMPPNNHSLVMWASLVQSILKTAASNTTITLAHMLMWPLKNMQSFTDVEFAGAEWYSLYTFAYYKIKDTNHIQEVWDSYNAVLIMATNKKFILNVALAIFKFKLLNENGENYKRDVEKIQIVVGAVQDYQHIQTEFPVIVDSFVLLLNKLTETSNNDVAHYAINVVMDVLKLVAQSFKLPANKENPLSIFITKLHKAIDEIYKNKTYTHLKRNIVEDLMEYLSLTNMDFPFRKDIISILNTYVLDFKETDFSFFSQIKTNIGKFENNPSDVSKSKFTTPNRTPKAITRKAKKREASVVDTVVENGEEYVVVKSNWKFNPRKLTENQKEKFQRKREDIPALYQDLSQSQDEFKLTTWKTDSQDTSTTNSSKSNSKTAEESSSILRNIPSSEVVPKIIENIFSEKTDNNDHTIKPKSEDKANEIKQNISKNTKSPRVALKDRVFRNVRNLIEKSTVHKDVNDMSESLIQIENVPKTPVSKEQSISNLTNSAPPMINGERPTRVKRKPKKFDDSELFALKKIRNFNQNDSLVTDVNMDEVHVVDNNSLASENRGTESENEHSDVMKENNKIETSDNKTHRESNEENKDIPKSNNKVDSSNHELDNIDVSLEPVNTISVAAQVHEEKLKLSPNNKEIMTPKSVNGENAQDSATEKKVVRVEMSEDASHICEKDDNSAHITKSLNSVDVDNAKKSNAVEKILKENSENSESVNSPKTSAKEDSPVSSANNSGATEESHEENSKISPGDTAPNMTPKSGRKKVTQDSLKKNSIKKSRIEKELAIDMVEGHPYLKAQPEQRLTRKKLNDSVNIGRRKNLTEKLNKTKLDIKLTKLEKKGKEKDKTKLQNISQTSKESNEIKSSNSIDDLPCSEDIIESSQDSTVTTISVKSVKPVMKKVSVVVENMPINGKINSFIYEQHKSIMDSSVSANTQETRDDIELSHNKTAIQEHNDENLTEMMDTELLKSKDLNDTTSESKNIQNDLTEDMDTEPFDDKNSGDVIVINDDEPPITIDSENTFVGKETQELAEADTLPVNATDFIDSNKAETSSIGSKDDVNVHHTITDMPITNNTVETQATNSDGCKDISIAGTLEISGENEGGSEACSPYRDEAQRKQDFLDNTLEISPIKTLSPVRDKKSPTPETSSDYVVIKLSSPVQSNGEPFEKCDSPEIFTEDKVSPDKRDQSPPREEISVNNNNSPSSSLSLKKNRPQVRYTGRAAQMLGLCVPDRIHTIMNSERSEVEEPKRCSPSSTQARRNLRILYNSVGINNESTEENENNENFLKLKRSLPTSTSSPSGPILKRKLAEIADDATVSPASKRKRVSFHDPPVSTTVSVQKYIEPCGIRSPQNSAQKRQERQLRSHSMMKSPKRLDNVFKLDTVLTKAVESFNDGEQNLSADDTQIISLDETPVVEVVKTSDLNDKDPICPMLLDCDDSIELIATELSSPTMKVMFLKELEGKIATIGDLAKMTELEVNRLCIKAPKVCVARKVLLDYASKITGNLQDKRNIVIDLVEEDEEPVVPEIEKTEMEVQTDSVVLKEVEIQTNEKQYVLAVTQTDNVIVTHTHVQTQESSTLDIINTCLSGRLDFVEKLSETLEDAPKQHIADSLPFSELSDLLMKKVNKSNFATLLNSVLDQSASCVQNGTTTQLSLLQNYMCERFETKDLILFCSKLLQHLHDKPV